MPNITAIRTFTTTLPTRNGLADFFDDALGGWRWNNELPGRPWEASELRHKSFEDLHKLWYVCIKEQNLLASQEEEARRFRLEYPHGIREKRLRKTMSRIKLVLWERHSQYTQAMNIVSREKKREQLRQQLIAKSKPIAETDSTTTSSSATSSPDVTNNTTSISTSSSTDNTANTEPIRNETRNKEAITTLMVDEEALEAALAKDMPYVPPSEKVKKILEAQQNGPRKPRGVRSVKPRRVLNKNPSISQFIV